MRKTTAGETPADLLSGQRLSNAITDDQNNTRTETYGYDALSRLTNVNYADGITQSYTFDPMGNRLSKTENGIAEGYTYNCNA